MITPNQQKALSLLPIIPAALSIMGSTMIIRQVVFYQQQQQQSRSYERILVGLSLSDILLSVTLVGMNFWSPRGTMVWSIGNSGTCAALGTLYQWGAFSAGLYNASLSVYYVLTIRYGISTTRMAQSIEPFFHGISILFPLLTALWGLAIPAYDFIPSLGLCWVNHCGTDCNVARLRYIFASPILVSWVTIGISMCGIWQHVRSTIRQHDDNSTVLKIREQSGRLPPPTQSNERQQLSMVATQAILYVGSFSMISVWPIALSVIEQHESIQSLQQNPKTAPWLFAMMCGCAIFFPMSGFFNCFIYVRPRYLLERKKRMDETRWETLRRVLFRNSDTAERHSSACRTTVSPLADGSM